MAEQNIPSFAVDSDITPLQGRYFQYAKTGITDPRVRAQAYGLIKQTFGGIQQARDIQRAKQQEDEQRALQMDMNRAQLDKYKLDLLNARDEYRRKQDSAALNSKFYSDLDAIRNNKDLSVSERVSLMNSVAAQNAELVTNDPVAQNRFKLELDAQKAQQTKQSSSQDASRLRSLVSSGVYSPEALADAGLGQYVGSALFNQLVAAKEKEDQLKAAEDATKAKEDAYSKAARRIDTVDKIVNRYTEPLEALTRAATLETRDKDGKETKGPLGSSADVDWTGIDDLLNSMDKLGAVDEKDKKDLLDAGIRAFEPDAKLPKVTPEQFVERNRKAIKVINRIKRKAYSTAEGKTAPPAGGFDASSLAN